MKNYIGKVFTQEEYIGLSKLLDKYPRIIVLADQVYSHVTFEGNEFINFANIGDNWKKTISVFSGGKVYYRIYIYIIYIYIYIYEM